MSESSLGELYEGAESQFLAMNGQEGGSGFDMAKAVDLAQRGIVAREKAALYSKNEDLTEFSTTILKFLYLEYYLAKFCTQCVALDKRLKYLQYAKRCFENYLAKCSELTGILHDEEVLNFVHIFPQNEQAIRCASDIGAGDGFGKEQRSVGFDGEEDEGGNDSSSKAVAAAVANNKALSMKHATPNVLSMTPEQQRNFKVAKFRREKETQKRIQYLQFKTRKAQSKNRKAAAAVEEEQWEEEDAATDAEDTLRELYILQLQSFARDALDEVTVLEQELVMLAMMEGMRQQRQATLGDGGVGSSNADANAAASGRFNDDNDPTGMARQNLAHMPLLPALPPVSAENNPGIEITRTGKGPDGRVLMNKETVRANVFVPSMEGPSMTLEEFGDLEKADAIERARRQAENEISGKGADTENLSRRYDNLVADGDEDVERLVDAATINDRDWDAFKEANPKGWGNKAGKQF